MTENLILADEVFIRNEFGIDDYVYVSEGAGGKHVLRQLFKDKDIHYKETLHGVDCLKKIRIGRCAGVSPSAAGISEMPVECWWFG